MKHFNTIGTYLRISGTQFPLVRSMYIHCIRCIFKGVSGEFYHFNFTRSYVHGSLTTRAGWTFNFFFYIFLLFMTDMLEE